MSKEIIFLFLATDFKSINRCRNYIWQNLIPIPDFKNKQKNLNKLEIERNFLIPGKGSYKNPTKCDSLKYAHKFFDIPLKHGALFASLEYELDLVTHTQEIE